MTDFIAQGAKSSPATSTVATPIHRIDPVNGTELPQETEKFEEYET